MPQRNTGTQYLRLSGESPLHDVTNTRNAPQQGGGAAATKRGRAERSAHRTAAGAGAQRGGYSAVQHAAAATHVQQQQLSGSHSQKNSVQASARGLRGDAGGHTSIRDSGSSRDLARAEAMYRYGQSYAAAHTVAGGGAPAPATYDVPPQTDAMLDAAQVADAVADAAAAAKRVAAEQPAAAAPQPPPMHHILPQQAAPHFPPHQQQHSTISASAQYQPVRGGHGGGGVEARRARLLSVQQQRWRGDAAAAAAAPPPQAAPSREPLGRDPATWELQGGAARDAADAGRGRGGWERDVPAPAPLPDLLHQSHAPHPPQHGQAAATHPAPRPPARTATPAKTPQRGPRAAAARASTPSRAAHTAAARSLNPRSRTPPSTTKTQTPPGHIGSATTTPPGPPSTVRELLSSARSQLELTPAPSTPGAPPGSGLLRVLQVTPPALKDATPPPPEAIEAAERVVPLPRPSLLPPADPAFDGGLTVVFDLDETLVSNRRPGVAAAIPRPFLDELFQQIEGHTEVALWTASTDDTGRPVVEQIDMERRRFHHLIFRNPLWFTEPAHTKDLSLLGRSMEKVLLIENTPNCCKFHRNNSLLVEDFTPNSQNDRMLLTVAVLIRDCAAAVRRGVSVPRFLQMRAQLQAGVEEYELGLPLVFQNMPVDEAHRHIEQLDPLMQPPLGNFFYVKNMRHAGRELR